MNIWKGTAVSDGIAVGTASVYRRNARGGKRYIMDCKAESEKFAAVKSLAIDELDRLFSRAHAEIGENAAQIFSIHKLMLEDIYYNESVLNIIEKERVSAETAVLMTSDSFERLFSGMENAYMRERAGDIRDVSDRIIALLDGKSCPYPDAEAENTIIFADNITPSEAMQMDKSKVSAFVTERGSETSHTAILARSLGIPAVAGIRTDDSIDGKLVAVDGYTGTVYVEPDKKVISRLLKESEKRTKKRKSLEETKKLPSVTKSGKSIAISVDMSVPEEAKYIPSCDGAGILRAETLYKSGKGLPKESFLFDAYRKVIEGMKNKPVSICALDVDEDKKGDFFGIFCEKNPEMGMKGIRICLMRPEIFKVQLRALVRAAFCGEVRLLLPMVVSGYEVDAAKKLLEDTKRELKAEKNIPVGILIETPAAAINSDELAKKADFFVIDADRLTQYILAMDRQNLALAELFDMRHSTVFRAIEWVAENAHKNGIKVGLCGAIASDGAIIPTLLKMGIDELAVKPKKLLSTGKAVQES